MSEDVAYLIILFALKFDLDFYVGSISDYALLGDSLGEEPALSLPY